MAEDKEAIRPWTTLDDRHHAPRHLPLDSFGPEQVRYDGIHLHTGRDRRLGQWTGSSTSQLARSAAHWLELGAIRGLTLS
jgi:hypothetical protein